MDLAPFYEAFLRLDMDHARSVIGGERYDELHQIGTAMGAEESVAQHPEPRPEPGTHQPEPQRPS